MIAHHFYRVNSLASRGADVEQARQSGRTPLQSAAPSRADDKVIRRAHSISAPTSRHAIRCCCVCGGDARTTCPLSRCSSSMAPTWSSRARRIFKPLPLAIAEEAKYVSAKASDRRRPSTRAARPGNPDALTPLMIAACQNSPAEGVIFLPGSTRPTDTAKGRPARGANVNAQSKKGVTPLMIAAAHNNPPMIGILIESGADVTRTRTRQDGGGRGRAERGVGVAAGHPRARARRRRRARIRSTEAGKSTSQ